MSMGANGPMRLFFCSPPRPALRVPRTLRAIPAPATLHVAYAAPARDVLSSTPSQPRLYYGRLMWSCLLRPVTPLLSGKGSETVICLKGSDYGRIDPSGMVAPLSDLAFSSCSVVTVAPLKSAPLKSAPIKLASEGVS